MWVTTREHQRPGREGPLAERGVGHLVVGAQTDLYWKYQIAPGRTAATVTTGEVTFPRAHPAGVTGAAPASS